jgi:hypothetical protein
MRNPGERQGISLRTAFSLGNRHRAAVLLILLVAALFRAWLIATDGVSFDSDEAVIGLMARHINQGHAVPTFFYGQDYMGSLDAILAAGGFRVFGESVHVLRAVQMILYLLSLVAAYRLAHTITRSDRIAGITLLLLAIPTALGALYTSIAIGGYNETVLFGSLILLLSWQVTVEGRRELWRWAALGLAAGMGWWTNGAIVTACAVAGLLGLRYSSPRQWRGYALVGIAFFVGSAPWWVYNLRHDWAALGFLTGGFKGMPGAAPISPGERLAGLLVLGLPALYGLRFPWEAGFAIPVGVVAAVLVYLILLTDLLAGGYARLRRGRPYPSGQHAMARHWVWLVLGVFAAIFSLSSFSDSTGRYLMPVWVPVAIGVALGLDRLRRAGRWAAAVALGVLLAVQAGTVIRAAHTGTGLTPQLVERLRTPQAYDAALLDFLADQGYTRGYASYWTSFRVVFRAHERVILDTALPHDDKGYIEGDNRYPPYSRTVAETPRVVWITQNFPALDALIARRLDQAAISYRTRGIGPYRVYYAFSRRVAPADLGLTSPHPLDELAAGE